MKYIEQIIAKLNLTDVLGKRQYQEENELGMQFIDEEIAPRPVRAQCSQCGFWTKNPGNYPNALMCAVNIPYPTDEAFAEAQGRKAWAYHDCPDFEPIAHD